MAEVIEGSGKGGGGGRGIAGVSKHSQQARTLDYLFGDRVSLQFSKRLIFRGEEFVEAFGFLASSAERVVEGEEGVLLRFVEPGVGADIEASAVGGEFEEEGADGREDQSVDGEIGIIQGEKLEVQPTMEGGMVGKAPLQEGKSCPLPLVGREGKFDPLLVVDTTIKAFSVTPLSARFEWRGSWEESSREGAERQGGRCGEGDRNTGGMGPGWGFADLTERGSISLGGGMAPGEFTNHPS